MIRSRSALPLAVGLWLLLALPAAGQTPPLTVTTPAGEVTVVADRIEQVGPEELFVATGNVEITRGGARLLADRVEINRETGDAVATGRVMFYDGDDRISADRIDYNVNTGTGVLYGGDARTAPYYRLKGERMERLGDSIYRVEHGVFTTCEADPPPWSVKMREATADLNSYVIARDASFWVKRLPLIPWVPFFAAPIRRERQTGFLFPRLGAASRKGFTAEIPFFWAISDSQGVTFTLLAYERRGEGLSADYRYILSSTNEGSFRGFVVEESQRHGAERAWGSIRHDWRITSAVRFMADVRGVSDDRLLRDYGDGLQQENQQFMRSNLFLSGNSDSWSAVGNAFWYQDLTTDRPIELNRLPDILVQSVRQPIPGVPGALWEFDSNATHFARVLGSEGNRLDVHPRVSAPIALGRVMTITPFVGGRLTGYDRTVTGTHLARGGFTIEDTRDDPRVRRLVESGADVETVAARTYAMGGWQGIETMLHSIEAHATYTRITGEEMNKLPAWTTLDSIERTSLFQYSLTNRLFGHMLGVERPRIELVRFALSHALDLRENRPLSGDVIADLLIDTGRIRLRGDVVHDTHGHGLQNAAADVSVDIDRVTASIGSRFNEPGNINFLQGVVTTDVLRNVTSRVSTNWDIRTNRVLETRVATDIKFQCYAFTVEFIQRNVVGRPVENEVRVAVNLLGMGGPFGTSFGLGALGGGIGR